jgi:hypothetical protein
MRNKMLLIAMVVLPLAAHAAKGGARMDGFFTPEQRAMFVMQAHDQVKDMTPDERKTFRHDQVARFMAMSDSDKARLKADLQAKWDALPDKRKARIEERIAARGGQGQPLTPQDLNPGSAVVK